jgi:hypothetical protein
MIGTYILPILLAMPMSQPYYPQQAYLRKDQQVGALEQRISADARRPENKPDRLYRR